MLQLKLIVPQLGVTEIDFDNILEIFCKANYFVIIPADVSVVDETTVPWTGNSIQKIERKGSTKKKTKNLFQQQKKMLQMLQSFHPNHIQFLFYLMVMFLD